MEESRENLVGTGSVGGSGEAAPQSGEPEEKTAEGEAEIRRDARMWAMFCHLSGLAGLLPVVPVIGAVIAPLILWQVKKEEHPFVDEQGKEALNFQISILIYEVVAGLLCFACIGFFLLPAVVVFDVVFLIIAAIKANNGEHYVYPLKIRFVR
ncbi:MAG TPA: DUF4870 domain-containing protein [Sedimentisphaerales bacterium]|nr:DUF4870 domain-containing protein [Sedimentisphaerales bacterium]